MNTAPIPTRQKRGLLSPAALLGASVLVASLGAAAGWMLHAPRFESDTEASRLALAPNESVVSPTADTGTAKPAPVESMPTQGSTAVVPVAPAAPTTQHAARHAPARIAQNTSHGAVAGSGTAGATGAPAEKVAAVCTHCGTIESVQAVQRKGEGSGVGAVGGAVVGGVLGNQVGKGNGRSVATLIGLVGGGIAGNEIEKRVKTETVYEVRVRMDDGSTRTFTERTPPQAGARVTIENGQLRMAS